MTDNLNKADFNEKLQKMWMDSADTTAAPKFNLLSNEMEEGSYLNIRIFSSSEDSCDTDCVFAVLVRNVVDTAVNTTFINVYTKDGVARFYFN